MTPLSALPAAFRAKAELLEAFSLPAATAFRQAAEEVEKALAESQLEALDLDAAAQESGYSAAHLRRMLREGTVPDAGGGRILRRDLPKKPGGRLRTAPERVGSRLQVAHAVVTNGRR
ncbi:MAG TPA: hypothetical protein VGR27_00980 [Longimicrobiaceae bacterium]|nr:hypothetical protein [Longimicrobiaceae bacterium]